MMKALMTCILLVSALAQPSLAAGQPRGQARRHAVVEETRDDTAPIEEIPIRTQRPISLCGNFLGKTPLVGATADVNVLPWVGLGLGYGFFSFDGVSGSFIPAFVTIYPLKSNFSPFVQGGIDFVTVTFQSTNSLLNSTFRGSQLIVGGGLEYRFDFGLVARLDLIRYIGAQLFAPGASLGYSIRVD